MRSIVVAYDQARGIGARGMLPWGRLQKADLHHFQALTMGSSIIMGHTTYTSIGHALPGRETIVVTHRPISDVTVISAESLAKAYEMAHGNQFIVGGASLYQAALADVTAIYATEIHHSFPEVDVWFPSLDATWRERSRQSYPADDDNRYAYDFVAYVRTIPPLMP